MSDNSKKQMEQLLNQPLTMAAVIERQRGFIEVELAQTESMLAFAEKVSSLQPGRVPDANERIQDVRKMVSFMKKEIELLNQAIGIVTVVDITNGVNDAARDNGSAGSLPPEIN
jgi:hypothetical protein